MTRFLEDTPNILYKYRDWNNSYNKKILLENELYLPSANQFNDPFDAALPFTYNEDEMTDDAIFEKYYYSLKEQKPELSDTEIHSLAYEYHYNIALLRDEQHIERHHQKLIEDINKLYGILSLTSDRNNFLMWSHYACSHTGFCIGFDKYKLWDALGGMWGPVEYVKEFPKFSIYETATYFSQKLLFRKSENWYYEQEYRIIKSGMAKGKIILHADVYSEIILGCKMPQKTKFQILDLAAEKFPNTIIYDLELHKSKFELVLKQIR